MLYSLDITSTGSSLVEASYLVNIISWDKVVLWKFEVNFIVAVYRYFATSYVEYLAWSTEI